MKRIYLSGYMRSTGYGKRVVKGPQNFRRRSLPEKPHFIKVAGKGWDDWRSPFDPVQLRRLIKHKVSAMYGPGYKALADRAAWLKQYGLRQKLRNAASSTEIRRRVRNRRK